MMASDSDEELDQEVANDSDEELDPEMAEDHEENVPGLEELIEEMFGSDEREELEAVMDPAEAEVHFDLELEPVPMDFDPYDHPTMPSLSNTANFTKVPNVEIVGEQIQRVLNEKLLISSCKH